MTRFQLVAHHSDITYRVQVLILTSVDVLVDQRKKFNCIGLIPGKLLTGNNCMCEHSFSLAVKMPNFQGQKKKKKKTRR